MWWYRLTTLVAKFHFMDGRFDPYLDMTAHAATSTTRRT